MSAQRAGAPRRRQVERQVAGRWVFVGPRAARRRRRSGSGRFGTRPFARSTSDHRRATSSPRRAPVSAARAMAVGEHRVLGLGRLKELRELLRRRDEHLLLAGDGGVARSVGARSIHPHLTAWRRRPRGSSGACARSSATVPRRAIGGRRVERVGAEILQLDPAEHRSNSMVDLRRFSYSVRGRWRSRRPRASGRGAGRRSRWWRRPCPGGLPSRTRPALRRWRSVPTNVFETCRGFPVTGSAPAKARSCHRPEPGGRSRMVPGRSRHARHRTIRTESEDSWIAHEESI